MSWGPRGVASWLGTPCSDGLGTRGHPDVCVSCPDPADGEPEPRPPGAEVDGFPPAASFLTSTRLPAAPPAPPALLRQEPCTSMRHGRVGPRNPLEVSALQRVQAGPIPSAPLRGPRSSRPGPSEAAGALESREDPRGRTLGSLLDFGLSPDRRDSGSGRGAAEPTLTSSGPDARETGTGLPTGT